MINYKKYLSEKGLTNNDVIKAVQEKFPKFTKVQCSMISSPDKYGVALSPAAEKHLLSVYGKPKRKTASRSKKNRLVLYLDDAQYQRLLDAKGNSSSQEYIEQLIEKEPVS